MSTKQLIKYQCQDKANLAASQLASLPQVRSSWLRTTRRALGMSGAQLARRLGVTRSQVSKVENAESSGSVNLKTLQLMAEAMGCKFVYAIVPNSDIDSLLDEQARKKAKQNVDYVNQQMLLEGQGLTAEALEREVERVSKELLANPPKDFWDN